MNRRFLFVALFVSVAAWFLWPSDPETWNVRNVRTGNGPIVCFGDSLTFGHGATPAESYPAVLATMLGREVVNRGRNGDTTPSALERLDRDVLALRPSVVILTLGGNDMLQRVPVERTLASMREIFTRLLDAGAMVVFLAIDPPFAGGERMERIAELSRDLGVLFVPDAMEGLWDDRGLMADRIHPNAAGYRRMAERIHDAVDDKL